MSYSQKRPQKAIALSALSLVLRQALPKVLAQALGGTRGARALSLAVTTITNIASEKSTQTTSVA
jgi:hypothetical protein